MNPWPGWERVGESAGGTVGGLASVLEAGRAVVFAATPVGIHTSSDAGQTWSLSGTVNNVPLAEVVVPSARFAQDRTLFACAADGLYRSTNAGQAWWPVLIGSRMLSAATAPAAAGEGLVLVASETDGVLRSEDDGRTWTGANAGLLDLTAVALALSPEFASDRTGFVGTASGLYRTRNGARSWRSIETELADPAVQCVSVSPTFAADRLVLAGTEADGLLLSEDAGASWHRPPLLADHAVTALAYSTRYAQQPTIAVAIESGIAVSDDGGRTWRITGAPPGVVLSLAYAATDGDEVLLAGLDRLGVARSTDDGARWSLPNQGLNARLLTGLVLSPAFASDTTLFTAGPQDGVSMSEDGGRTWTDRTTGLPDAAVLGLAVSPAYAEDRTLYAATAAGIHVSHDRAATWEQSPGTAQAVWTVAAGPAATVWAAGAGGGVRVSDDAVATWRTPVPAFDGGEIILVAVSPDYGRDRTVFVATTSQPAPGGSAEMVLWRSRDGGTRWDRWLVEPEVRSRAGVGHPFMAFAISPNYANDELVFAGLGPRVLTPLRHAREVRAGRRRPVWRRAELGGETIAVTAIAPSPNFAHDRTVFVATNAGAFASRDSGETYQPWSESLVPSALVALAVSPAYHSDRLVYALGLGGTIWRRQDSPG